MFYLVVVGGGVRKWAGEVEAGDSSSSPRSSSFKGRKRWFSPPLFFLIFSIGKNEKALRNL